MRVVSVVISAILILGGLCGSKASEPKPEIAATDHFFKRLDSNGDGKVTLVEAPDQGKMLVEFLLHLAGKRDADTLERADFAQFTHRHMEESSREKAVAASVGTGDFQPAPENCPACAMGLTAEFVFKRLDVDEDKIVTVNEFMRSPGMQDVATARDVVGRLDSSGDGKLSWEELETAYQARHAHCKKPDPSTLSDAKQAQPDGRGDGNRFAQVFMMRSDRNGDGKISQDEFSGPASGFERLDKNHNGFIQSDELGDLHQRRLDDPKSMKERIQSGDLPRPPLDKRPKGLGDAGDTK